jgi:6-phosphofructokinase 1
MKTYSQLLLLLFLARGNRAFLSISNRNRYQSVLREDLSSDNCSIDDENDTVACLLGEGYVPAERIEPVTQVYVAKLEKLSDRFESSQKTNLIRFDRASRRQRLSKFHHESAASTSTSSRVDMEYNNLMDDDDLVLVDIARRKGQSRVSRAFVQAGPRQNLHFDPSNVNAAIVTCGGLCPGLNNVIRELTHSLHYLYGANKVYGITGGFHGFYKADYQPILLTNELVENIHHDGGTVLRSSRGGFDIDKILQFLRDYDIQQLYIIGGDGTHRGAYAIHQACVDAGDLNVSVAGIPKTIDNDVDFIDRSFGFASAVEAAQASIRTAKTEAMCNIPNGIGIIKVRDGFVFDWFKSRAYSQLPPLKLMGRSAGFLAAFSALGSGDVDLVLVPEVPIVLDGDDGILPFIRKRVKEHKYAVVVVAEGAGEELLGKSTVVDAGGNRDRPMIGEFIKTAISNYFEAFGEETTIKYIDPSYTVRSVPANAADSMYCTQLAQSAVHGAMAGYTGFSTGLVNNQLVYLPIPQLVASSPRTMNPNGNIWGRIVAMTGQPNTAVVAKEDEVGELCLPEPLCH